MSDINLTTCIPGQKLLSKHGQILTYVSHNPTEAFPHIVRYQNGSVGSRLDNGQVFAKNRSVLDEDVVQILPINHESLRFYTADDRHTSYGVDLAHEINIALKPIFTKWASMGFSSREIMTLAIEETNLITCETNIQQMLERRKNAKKSVWSGVAKPQAVS
jgi:hypothetical protein